MLTLERLTKRFGETTAVADVSLDVAPGQFLTLLGPSGCGKTTTLRMVAGFESPTAGRIRIGGRDVTALPPQRREVGMVFQNYALFPHLDVFENVAFGLKARGARRADAAPRVARALELVDLAGFERRRVQELSGGQQQRVALARALAPEPPILLLDEPLSNLDAALRERTRAELRSLLKELGITTVFVTHDQEEAFALSDRIAVMNAARLEQVDTPEALYYRPATPFVASFLGKANFLPARVEAVDGDAVTCALPGGVVWQVRSAGRAGEYVAAGSSLADAAAIDATSREAAAPEFSRTGGGASGRGSAGEAPFVRGGDALVMVRPESLRVSRPATGGPGAPNAASNAGGMRARVAERRFAGATTVYRLVVAGAHELLAWGAPDAASAGEEIEVELVPGAVAYAFPVPPEGAP